MFRCFFLFLILCTALSAETITVDLNDPIAQDGSIYTENGGIISTDKMRVQAQKILYRNLEGEKILKAENHLLIRYEKKFFVGDSFTYNFTTKVGVIEKGVASVDGIYVGGEKILFHADGEIEIIKAFATTSDKQIYDWSIRAKDVKMDKTTTFHASGITFHVANTPIFWFPSFSMTASKKFRKDPVALYRIFWDKGQGPLFVARYRIADYQGVKVHLRGEYSITRGWGGALELDYLSPKKRQELRMRNLYSYTTFYNDPNPNKYRHRYRIQGLYKGMSEDKKIESFARWDVLSDRFMRADFPTQLFELQTLERTEAFVKARYDFAFTSIYGRPRVNSFRGFKQELPTFKVAVKPLTLGNTGLIFQNYFNLAYLDYVYANQLHHLIPNFDSARLQTVQTLYRPFNFNCLHITPEVGFNGIYYSKSPCKTPLSQALLSYGVDAHLAFEKDFPSFTHQIKPYITYKGIASPEAKVGTPYIFSLQDGFNRINEIKLGLKNYFFKAALQPRFYSHLYAYSFPGAFTFNVPFPKAGLDLHWHYPKLDFGTRLGWNIEKQAWDFSNFYLGFTLNEYFAVSAELRHRGRFDWRKNNHENFILDVSRTIFELQHSPISDERTIFLSRWQLQFAPFWTLQVINQVGWRPSQPFYHESQFCLTTILSNAVSLKFNYTRKVNANIFTFGANLI